MKKDHHIEKLPNAPLQEVIFELIWEMDYDNSGRPVDPDFEFAQGVFAEKIEKDFPFRRRTVPENFPVTIYPKPIHQFWKSEQKWPVIQIGPGILTVNDIEKNYTWTAFKKLILFAVDLLTSAYKKELSFNIINLKYIDAVEIKKDHYLEFINNNFNVNLKNNIKTLGQVVDVKINETFLIENIGNLNFMLASGLSKNYEPSVIWQSNIFFRKKFKSDSIERWIDDAHEVVSDFFKDIIKDSLYDKFISDK